MGFDLQFDAQHQTIYAEFEGKVSKSQLKKIDGVGKVESVNEGWLLESTKDADLRKTIAKYAQENDLLVITLRKEEQSLEEVFKNLTSNK